MMFRIRFALAAATALLVGGVAAAQPASSADSRAAPATPAQSAPASSAQSPAAPAASDAASQASAATTEPPSANVAVTTDANGVRHLLVASPPAPDTPENRAKYGGPMSNAGQRTQAAGN
jgi:hypothetical protein